MGISPEQIQWHRDFYLKFTGDDSMVDLILDFEDLLTPDAWKGNMGVGKGWIPAVRECFSKLKALNIPNFKVLQVKEKFGRLRIYYTPQLSMTEYSIVEKILIEAENRCDETCEGCGVPNNEIRGPYWLKNYCNECRKPH